MRIVPALRWRLDDGTMELDPRLMPLLAAVERTGSLAAAVDACGISYRAAWGMLRDWHARLGVTLVRLERGRGAGLTDVGQGLLRAEQAAVLRLARLLPELGFDARPSAREDKRAAVVRLAAAASHDLALAAFAETLPAMGIELDLSFMGSLHALQAYAEGNTPIAGFHVPITGRTARDRAPFLRFLRARRDRLVRFVDRNQGLILPRGNARQIRNIRDVAANGLRFVNRQRGSGTRILIDHLLAEAKIDPQDLPGYGKEEFTHAAVAATVASGGADAGFGIGAAAAEYGLAFVPMVRERYFLAVRASEIERPPMRRLLAALAAPGFARLVTRIPGYAVDGAGAVSPIAVLTDRAMR